MIKITVQDTIEKICNRFDLVLIAAKRARQIQDIEKEVLTEDNHNKCTVLALKEMKKKLIVK